MVASTFAVFKIGRRKTGFDMRGDSNETSRSGLAVNAAEY